MHYPVRAGLRSVSILRVLALDSAARPVKIDTAVPVTARIWNCRLGGKEVGDQLA
jgi:hypothetical protein